MDVPHWASDTARNTHSGKYALPLGAHSAFEPSGHLLALSHLPLGRQHLGQQESNRGCCVGTAQASHEHPSHDAVPGGCEAAAGDAAGHPLQAGEVEDGNIATVLWATSIATHDE